MKNPVMKTWKRIMSFGHKSSITKSKSWSGSICLEDSKNTKSPPPQHGFFTVYVGPMKRKFVVRTQLVSHPLFKNLLEEAKKEYGCKCNGPIVLPCEVDFFFKVLDDIKKSYEDGGGDDDDDDGLMNPSICGMFSPYRSYGNGDGRESMAMRRISSYKLLRSPSLFKFY